MDQARVFSSFVFNPRLDVLDFLEFILSDFGITPQNRTKSGMLIQLNRWLVERYRRDETCVIIVDEAQNLEWELLEEIRLLTNLETSSEKLVQIVLSGQPELEARISTFELAAHMQMAATDALDFSKESDATKEMYGLNDAITAAKAKNVPVFPVGLGRNIDFTQRFA